TTHKHKTFKKRGLSESASTFVHQPLETAVMPDGSIRTFAQNKPHSSTATSPVSETPIDAIWQDADSIDVATFGALTAFQIVFGILEDASASANAIKDTAAGYYLTGYIDQLYYLIGDLHTRVKTARESAASIASKTAEMKRA